MLPTVGKKSQRWCCKPKALAFQAVYERRIKSCQKMQICKLFGKSHLPNSNLKQQNTGYMCSLFTHSSTSEIKLDDLYLKTVFVVIGHFIMEQEQNFEGQPKK